MAFTPPVISQPILAIIFPNYKIGVIGLNTETADGSITMASTGLQKYFGVYGNNSISNRGKG